MKGGAEEITVHRRQEGASEMEWKVVGGIGLVKRGRLFIEQYLLCSAGCHGGLTRARLLRRTAHRVDQGFPMLISVRLARRTTTARAFIHKILELVSW